MNKPYVKLIAYTPEPEKVVAMSGKLCYSPVGVDKIEENLTPEEIDRFVSMLTSLGHHSTLEHVSFTFAVEGISRSCSHQIVRHRIASFSQQSQRYVPMYGDFNYITPSEIANDEEIQSEFNSYANHAYLAYLRISDRLIVKHSIKYLKSLNLETMPDDKHIIEYMMQNHKKKYKQIEKLAIEDARAILPNASETKLVLTMNARSLIHFFEKRCCCYDEATEVLTKDGWKYFKELTGNEEFYSLNSNNMENEYCRAKEKMSYDFDGNMVKIDSQSINQLVTPNHKMFMCSSYYNKHNNSKWNLVDASDNDKYKNILMKKNCVPINGKIEKYFKIPAYLIEKSANFKNYNIEIKEKHVDIVDWFKFIGFYVCDGYVSKSGGHHIVGLSKGDINLINKYKKILESITDNTVRVIEDGSSYKLEVCDKRLYEVLKVLGKAKDKRLPSYVWDYDHTILENLFEGISDGDMNRKNNSLSSISKEFVNDFQRLMLHMGYSSTISVLDRIGQVSCGLDSVGKPYSITTQNVEYRASVNRIKNTPIIKNKNRNAFSEEYYKGKVYCVELEKNNILYIRRNGKTSWSGNSRAQDEVRLVAIQMLKQVKEVAPSLFKQAGAPCVNGTCPEGVMSCKNL